LPARCGRCFIAAADNLFPTLSTADYALPKTGNDRPRDFITGVWRQCLRLDPREKASHALFDAMFARGLNTLDTADVPEAAESKSSPDDRTALTSAGA
jgi:hypothetical protein